MLTGLRARTIGCRIAQARFAEYKVAQMIRTVATLSFAAVMAASLMSLVAPARAQIGNIFRIDHVLRQAFLRGSQCRTTKKTCRICRSRDAFCQPPIVRSLLRLPGRGVPPPDSVQTQPLPPPPGTAVAPPGQPGQAAPPNVANNPPVNTLPGLPPGQRQPRETRHRDVRAASSRNPSAGR